MSTQRMYNMKEEIAEIIADEVLDSLVPGVPISSSLKIISLMLQHECVNQSCPCNKRDCPKTEIGIYLEDDVNDPSGLVEGFEEFGEDLAYHIDGLEVGCECCCSDEDDTADLISNWIKDSGYDSTN